MKDIGSRLTRRALTLAEYDFDIIHRKERLHGNADALSRMYNKEDHYVDVELEEYEEHQKVVAKNIKTKIGDLLTAPENYALAHCVSRDFVMGKGIAKQFKETFGSVPLLMEQNKLVGEVAELKLPERNVYYMVTKQRYSEKPSYRLVWNALKNLKKCCENNQDRELAIPKIACGLDGLEWEKIQTMMEFIFYNTDIDVNIYQLPKNSEGIKVIETEEMIVPEWDRESLEKAQNQDNFCRQIKERLEQEGGRNESGVLFV